MTEFEPMKPYLPPTRSLVFGCSTALQAYTSKPSASVFCP